MAVSVLMTAGCWRVSAGHLSPAELESERQDRMDQAGGGYVSKVVHPFVVVGSDRETLEEAEETLTWARDRLLAAFYKQYRDHDLPPLPPRDEWERFVLALEYRR